MLKSNPSPNDFSLAGAAAASTILPWNSEGDTAVTVDFDGAPGSRTSYHRTASSAEEKVSTISSCSHLGGRRLSLQPLVHGHHVSASKPKINLLQLASTWHRYNPVPKSFINCVFASTVHLADPPRGPLSPRLLSISHALNQRVKRSAAPQRSEERLSTLARLQICGCAQSTGQIGSRCLLPR